MLHEVPAEDLALAKTYHALQLKGPLVAGQRITIMTHNTLFRMGEPLRVLHILEAVESGKDVHLMGRRGLRRVCRWETGNVKGPGKDPYRGVVVDRPIADFNYEITPTALPSRVCIRFNGRVMGFVQFLDSAF